MSANKQTNNNSEGMCQNRHTLPDSFAVHSSAATSAHFDGEALMNSSESEHKHSSEIRLLKIVACGLPAGYLTCLTKHSEGIQASLQLITLLLSKGIHCQTFVESAVHVKERPNCNKSVAFDMNCMNVAQEAK